MGWDIFPRHETNGEQGTKGLEMEMSPQIRSWPFEKGGAGQRGCGGWGPEFRLVALVTSTSAPALALVPRPGAVLPRSLSLTFLRELIRA